MTRTRDTPYPGNGYRVSRVRVRVGLGYPRVTRAIPYWCVSLSRCTLKTVALFPPSSTIPTPFACLFAWFSFLLPFRDLGKPVDRQGFLTSVCNRDLFLFFFSILANVLSYSLQCKFCNSDGLWRRTAYFFT